MCGISVAVALLVASRTRFMAQNDGQEIDHKRQKKICKYHLWFGFYEPLKFMVFLGKMQKINIRKRYRGCIFF